MNYYARSHVKVLSWLYKQNMSDLQKNPAADSEVSIVSSSSQMTVLSEASAQVMMESMRSVSQQDIFETNWSRAFKDVAHVIIERWQNLARKVIWDILFLIIADWLIPEDIFHGLL
ncbi:unnamed protein product [Ceutorhynchus assimilis]|uniref:Uncharacterized protein n=1 Tax=Ceutorhynchus assimilis TaxID=467358 RepID=A0A9N9MCZ0_9CUCU|nr:unnamed protein product [Ceutorhynchus assimilis]